VKRNTSMEVQQPSQPAAHRGSARGDPRRASLRSESSGGQAGQRV